MKGTIVYYYNIKCEILSEPIYADLQFWVVVRLLEGPQSGKLKSFPIEKLSI